MTQYALCDWERNGFNDSDWYACILDDEKNTIETVEIGTTRFANAMPSVAKYAPLTVEAIEKARELLEARLFEIYKDMDRKRIFEFDDLRLGEEVALTERHKNMIHEESSCLKCNGSGKWINPNCTTDQRDCFGCRGHGKIIGGKKKDANGKQEWKHFPQGTTGIVVDTFAFGTFFANGYKKKNRETMNASIRLADGSIMSVPFKKLRRTQDLLSNERLAENANRDSFDYHFASGFAGWFAWYSNHYVIKFLETITHRVSIPSVNQVAP